MAVLLDKFKNFVTLLYDPASKAVAVTPSDANELDIATRMLYVGTTGDVAVVLVNDTTPVIFKNVQKGTTLRIRVRQVMATDTNATDIVALH